MINLEVKHDVDLKKGIGLTILLGTVIGVTSVVTKECVEYSKNKIKKMKK